jgi:hypothetical protein
MANTHIERHGKPTFRSILNEVAPKNAVRLMGRARLANKIAKSVRGDSCRQAYAVKVQALLELATRFPEQIRIVNDANTPRFVLVEALAVRFGLHAPARVFGRG